MVKVINEPIINHIKEYDVILFGMGINNSMNSGFKYDIGLNFPEVLTSENSTPYGDKRKYGTVHCTVVDGITFAACYMDKGGYVKGDNVDYDALRWCIKLIGKRFKKNRIASPILGCSQYDGRGDKEKILKIFEEECNSIDITLYDYEQTNFKDECFYKISKLLDNFKKGTITIEEYENNRRLIEWQKMNGIFKEMPENFDFRQKKVKNEQKIKVKI